MPQRKKPPIRNFPEPPVRTPEFQSFGHALRWHLQENGTRPTDSPGDIWTIPAFAEKSGSTEHSIRDWLSGDTVPQPTSLNAIEGALFGNNPLRDDFRRQLRQLAVAARSLRRSNSIAPAGSMAISAPQHGWWIYALSAKRADARLPVVGVFQIDLSSAGMPHIPEAMAYWAFGGIGDELELRGTWSARAIGLGDGFFDFRFIMVAANDKPINAPKVHYGYVALSKANIKIGNTTDVWLGDVHDHDERRDINGIIIAIPMGRRIIHLNEALEKLNRGGFGRYILTLLESMST